MGCFTRKPLNRTNSFSCNRSNFFERLKRRSSLRSNPSTHLPDRTRDSHPGQLRAPKSRVRSRFRKLSGLSRSSIRLYESSRRQRSQPEKRSWASSISCLVRRVLGPVLAVKRSFLGMAMSSNSILSPLSALLPCGHREAHAYRGHSRSEVAVKGDHWNRLIAAGLAPAVLMWRALAVRPSNRCRKSRVSGNSRPTTSPEANRETRAKDARHTMPSESLPQRARPPASE